jgi:hypothetical protein
MATFTDPKKLEDYAVYKPLLKTAVGKIRKDGTFKFYFWEKFGYKDKERALLLIDTTQTVVDGLPTKPTGKGECSVDAENRVVLDVTSGKVKYGPAAKLLADAGATRTLKLPAEADEPVPETLAITYGPSEWLGWGEDAKQLIATYTKLLTAFRDLPPIDAAWADLKGRHADVKLAVAEIAKKKIDHAEREPHEKRLGTLLLLTQQLGDKIRKRAEGPKQPKPQPQQPTPVATSDPPPTATTQQPGAKPSADDEAEIRRQREARLQREAQEQQERADKLRKQADAVLDLLRDERDAVAKLTGRIAGLLARKTDVSASVRKDLEKLQRSGSTLVQTALATSGYKRLGPEAADFDAFESAVHAFPKVSGAEPNELAELTKRLQKLASNRAALDKELARLDPPPPSGVRPPRTMRGLVWGDDYGAATAAAKDIVGILGKERSGRSSPNGKANHIHVGGNAQYNVVFDTSGDEMRILGFVNGHMEKGMAPTIANEAARVEARASENGFVAVEVDLDARTMRRV